MKVVAPTVGVAASAIVYAIAYNGLGQAYNFTTGSYEDWNPAHRADYARYADRQLQSDIYILDLPFQPLNIDILFYWRLGASPADGDKIVAVASKSVESQTKVEIKESRVL